MKSNTEFCVVIGQNIRCCKDLNLSAKCANSYYPGYQYDTRSEVLTSIMSSELFKYEEN